MTEKTNEKEETFQLSIFFPKAPKKAKDREDLFNNVLSLIKEGKESMPAKLISKKRKKQIVLDSDEFMFSISFGRRVQTNTLVYDPEKNMETVNNIGNNIVNFLNTVLGEHATSPKVVSSKIVISSEESVNLARKIIGDVRIAKINAITKQVLNPIGIMLEYKPNGRQFTFFRISNETIHDGLSCSFTYKDRLPFNLLEKEYQEIDSVSKIIEMIIEAEL